MVKRYKPKKEGSLQQKSNPVIVKEKAPLLYRNIHCDSLPETYCLMWLFELEKKGFIIKDSIERAETYILFPSVTRNYTEQLKTKRVTRMEVIHGACQYSPDFQFRLTQKGLDFTNLFRSIDYNGKLKQRGKEFLIHHDGLVIIEVKGTAVRNENSTEEKWSVVKKWLWEKRGLYCNMWTTDLYYPISFTPNEFLFTPIKKQLKKLNWNAMNIDAYLNNQNKSEEKRTNKGGHKKRLPISQDN